MRVPQVLKNVKYFRLSDAPWEIQEQYIDDFHGGGAAVGIYGYVVGDRGETPLDTWLIRRGAVLGEKILVSVDTGG